MISRYNVIKPNKQYLYITQHRLAFSYVRYMQYLNETNRIYVLWLYSIKIDITIV